MSLQRLYSGELTQISDDEISVICGTDGEKRDGHSVLMRGLDTTEFMASSPAFQCEHVPPPIGCFTRLGIVPAQELGLGVPGDALCGIVRLADPSISDYIAEKRGLIKSGFYNTVSIGFDPVDAEPLDPSNPRGGMLITRSTLLECSAVSVPADPSARIIARSFRARSSAAASIFRSLPRVPEITVRSAMTQAGQMPAQKPIGLMTDYERTAYYREAHARRTLAVSACGLASRTAERDDRRADLEHLRAIGESYHARRH